MKILLQVLAFAAAVVISNGRTICNKPNEIFHDCIPTCRNTCKNWNSTGVCSDLCKPGCFCKDGYVLNWKGQCVVPEECYRRTCDKPHEKYYDGPTPCCHTTCDTYNSTRPCTQLCIRGACYCEKGYVKDNKGECVRPEDCNKEPECHNRNEIYGCIPTCRDTCENYNSTGPCSDLCKLGCHCKPDYVKDKDGLCVPTEECNRQRCDNPNEKYYNCMPDCWNTCENMHKTGVCPCEPGCFCTEGYVKNMEGKCVRPEDCNTHPTCKKPNEIYGCMPTCRDTCENMNSTGPCTKICILGCHCEPGYVKDKDGRCVRTEDCDTRRCDKPNEKYYECFSPCHGTCETYNYTGPCTAICIIGCNCKEGFVKNKAGRCIRPEQCPGRRRCPPCEYYDECGSYCPPTCRNPDPELCVDICKEGCFCKKPRIRRERDNRCVLPRCC